MGMPARTFFSELIDGLTLFFSIIEMVLLVTPARLASSRWDRPLSTRIECRRWPTSTRQLHRIEYLRHDGGSVRYFQQCGRAGRQSPRWLAAPMSEPARAFN